MDILVVDSTGRPPACFGKTCYINTGVTVNHANIDSAPACITEYSYISICPWINVFNKRKPRLCILLTFQH